MKNFVFFKGFGTLHDLFINFLNEEMRTNKGVKEQKEMLNKIEGLRDFSLLKEKDITNKNTQGIIKEIKTKTQRKNFFTEQKIVLRNALKLYDQRKEIINAFIKKDIYSGDVEKDVYYKSEESKPEFEEFVAEGTKIRRQKFDEKYQKGQGLKILTPNQMLSRLPVSLRQIKAGNNRSKKLSKTIYNNLINTI